MRTDCSWPWFGCRPAFFAVLLLELAIVCIAGSASAGKSAKVSLFAEYGLANPDSGSTLKSDVTITVRPMGASHLYDFPELFAFDRDQIAAPIAGGVNFGSYCEKDYEGRYWWYTFGCGENDLAVFQVEIKNGTDHIFLAHEGRADLPGGSRP